VAYSYVRYTGNGATTNYTFSFPYISSDHVKVRVAGVLVTTWSFLNSSTIQFLSAPANGAVIEIRRETPKDSLIVNFTDGSVLLERDLDLLATWDLYLAQETKDSLEGSIQQNSLGQFDALNKRIVNVADPVDPQDAVTKAYVDPVIDQAAASAAAAAASATASANSATAAAASYDAFDDRYLGSKAADPAVDNDGNALLVGAFYWNSTSAQLRVWTGTAWVATAPLQAVGTQEFTATAGQTSFTVTNGYNPGSVYVYLNGVLLDAADYTATNGGTVVLGSGASVGAVLRVITFFSPVDTVSIKEAAAASATAAAASASSASTSATNAASSAGNAAANAVLAEASRVDAQTSASLADSYKNQASTSATAAATSATNAVNSATAAATSASNASTSASGASASAGAASASANSAGTSATNAANSASSATASASAASTSATAAATSASNASTSATNASTSASAASGSATAAATSASNAATSATAAASSATSASASATSATASAAAASAVALGNEPVRPAIRPTLLLDFANTKQLDPRITFTRASTGTYYDGKTVAKAEENLFTYSQAFDNAAWPKSGNSVTVTADATTAPDGTSTADKMVEAAITAGHRLECSAFTAVNGAAYTISVYAKASERGFLYIRTNLVTTDTVGAWFNLSTGAVGTTSAGFTAAITSVGNGWYRCSVVCTANTTTSRYVAFGLSTADNEYSYLGDGTSGIFLWGAQMEQRSTITAYTPTTTVTISNYVPALQTAASGVARFQHDPITEESLGLLIEEQRANLLTYSEQFDNNAVYGKLNMSVSANVAVAPDGTLTADKLVDNTTSGNHQFSFGFTPAASTSYTVSFHVKAAEILDCSFVTTGGGVGTVSSTFSLSAGTMTGPGSIQPVGNGWYRCIQVFTTTTTDPMTIRFRLRKSGSDAFVGDGFSGVFIWGGQLETGAFATSYIQTVASQVTRSADAASMTGTNLTSWYKDEEGTLYCEGLRFDQAAFAPFISLNSGTSTPELYMTQVSSSGRGYSSILGSATSSGTWAVNTFGKLAFAFKANDFAVSYAGNTVGTSSSASLPAVTRAQIGVRSAGNNVLSGYIKKIAYYPTRVTNAQLQGMTTV
jgi:Phage T7 tail fibre protein